MTGQNTNIRTVLEPATTPGGIVKDPVRTYSMRGTPDADSKTRLVTADELMQRMDKDPAFREAVRLAGKAEGHVKEATMLFRHELKHNRESAMHEHESDLAVQLQKNKLAGKLDSEYDVHVGAKKEISERLQRGEKIEKQRIYSIAESMTVGRN